MEKTASMFRRKKAVFPSREPRKAGTDALSRGMAWRSGLGGPEHGFPPGAGLFVQAPGPAVPWGRACVSGSFLSAPISTGWVCTDPLPLLSVGRKCEKTAPRSVP